VAEKVIRKFEDLPLEIQQEANMVAAVLDSIPETKASLAMVLAHSIKMAKDMGLTPRQYLDAVFAGLMNAAEPEGE
jgi:hypothetical protein